MTAASAVRVRFSPSPTGPLHVGAARTALMNWLFARHAEGSFILRIEDTDRARSEVRHEAAILEDLAWLGLAWDEGPDIGGPRGPYRQSERVEHYREAAARLLSKGLAYPCFCDPADLEARRRRDLASGRAPRYPGTCWELSDAEVAACRDARRAEAVRLRAPAGPVSFDDLVRGTFTFQGEDLSDFVILKSDGTPSHDFAAAVDDAAMGITHVLRGEDHLSNTARQLTLYEEMGLAPPAFGHLPMVVDSDGRKLSKRESAMPIGELRHAGYPAEAVANVLALLGWSHPDRMEVLGLEELAAVFDLERVSTAAAAFDISRLDWLAAAHIRLLADERVAMHVTPLLRREAGFADLVDDPGRFGRFVAAVKDDLVRYADAVALAAGLGAAPELDEAACRDVAQAGREPVDALDGLLSACRTIGRDDAQKMLAKVKDAMTGTPPKTVMHGIRAALTGRSEGPGLADVMWVLDADECRARLAAARRCIS